MMPSRFSIGDTNKYQKASDFIWWSLEQLYTIQNQHADSNSHRRNHCTSKVAMVLWFVSVGRDYWPLRRDSCALSRNFRSQGTRFSNGQITMITLYTPSTHIVHPSTTHEHHHTRITLQASHIERSRVPHSLTIHRTATSIFFFFGHLHNLFFPSFLYYLYNIYWFVNL